jgi:antitoxin component of MazEF toxin-antitoxin module
METKDVGRIYVGRDGEGRLYIPKSMMQKLPFQHGEKLKLTFKDGVLVTEKL